MPRVHVENPLLRLLIGICEAGVVFVLLLAAAGFLGSIHWFFDLFSHFRFQYVACLLVATLVFAILRMKYWALASGLGCLLLAIGILKYFFPVRGEAEHGHALKIVNFNIHTANKRHGDVIAFLKSEAADVIFLMEVNRRWLDKLGSLREIYPHWIAEPREDNFGAVMMSRFPFTEEAVHDFGVSEIPTVEIALHIEDTELVIIGTHPVPPAGRRGSKARDDQMKRLAEHLRKSNHEYLVVVGDLNMTPYSPQFKRFLKRTTLSDGARGHGISATWMRHFAPLAIPIDHVLVSRGVLTEGLRVAESFGSDHNAMVAEIRW